MTRLSLIIFHMFFISPCFAVITVVDDMGNTLSFSEPAKRVISLSPGMTELIYHAGGLTLLKGVDSYSDYPLEAKNLPKVGSFNSIDIERVVTLQPDLVVAWESGNPPLQISMLKKLGINVYISEPSEFSDISSTIKRLGTLMGTSHYANNSVRDFNERLSQLQTRYPITKNNKKVFIQIWNKPLMTISGEHLISKIVAQCNGVNIFHDTAQVTLTLDAETVIEKNPDVILVTRLGKLGESWLSRWRQWPFMLSVKDKQLFTVNPDYVVRHTPRILDGIAEICGLLQPER